MKRINVVGVSGSGKSTFSRALAEAMGIPYIEMDDLFWQPDWQQPDDETFYATLRSALEPDVWVLDGNYARTMPIKWERADTVIWWMLTSYRKVRARYLAVMASNEHDHLRFIYITSPAQARAIVANAKTDHN
ncbi:MAG: AAA family ATPase [Pseudomonadales bacterium]